MVETLGPSLGGSVLLAVLLGIKHGCDPDHVAVVDGMTRARQLQGYWVSRLVGAQFAAGHGVIVLLAALAFHYQTISMPRWLDDLGLGISTLFLVIVGGANLAYAVRGLGPSGSTGRVHAHSVLGRLMGYKLHPAFVGMAFAISLDVMAQALMFAGGAGKTGAAQVCALAVAFSAGMVLMDATAGATLNWLGSRNAAPASRVLSGFIALVAIGTAVVRLVPEFPFHGGATLEQCGVWPGIFLIAATCIVCFASSFVVGLRRA